MNRNLIILILLALVFSTCEMPDRDNPWDEKATIDADAWSADGFQIQDVNLTSKKLNWTYTGDNRIEGFQIDRKIGAGEWQEEVYFAGKDEREWVDTSVVPDTTKIYTYRLAAVAGTNKSNERTGTVTVKFPAPTALILQIATDSTINISWSYSTTGQEGFKIDRRKGNEGWHKAVATVLESPFTDKIVLGQDYVYRVNAYYKEYNSGVATDSIIFPVLKTSPISNTTWTTAISGGEITRGTAITARGVVWSTSPTPTIELSTKTLDESGIGSFISTISELKPGTSYYLRAFATNLTGTAYGNQLYFTTNYLTAPSVTTTSVSDVKSYAAISGGTISSDGGAPITARGVCYSRLPNPTINDSLTQDGSGPDSFTSSITELRASTSYYVRAYATNSIGTAYGNQVSFVTTDAITTSITGKVWMDRNLGANRIATSSTDEQAFGDLYQWGRATDGHEKRSSQTYFKSSSNDSPDHDKFIIPEYVPSDWRRPQNDNLWQGVNGTNNPCPEGFRIPTLVEWLNEHESWNSQNAVGAFASPLKLPVAGYRSSDNGSLFNVGIAGYYWSSTIYGQYTYGLFISNFGIDNINYGGTRASGYSVRCIKN